MERIRKIKRSWSGCRTSCPGILERKNKGQKDKCQGQEVRLLSSNLESLETEEKGQGQAVKIYIPEIWKIRKRSRSGCRTSCPGELEK
jgi:hypothetical protein